MARPRPLLVLSVIGALVWAVEAEAHDPSAWGGLFRSRDDGARWLPVHEGRFIGAALALAISPSDVHHLLLGTDSGLLRSRNGGRDWTVEAPSVLIGGVFAAQFDADGVRALASTARDVFRTEDGVTWRRASVPREVLPARAIVRGGAPGRVYLGGGHEVWRSDDWGASWTHEDDGLPAAPVSALLVAGGTPETVYAVVGGRVWMRADRAGGWEPRDAGLPAGRIDTVAADATDSARLWAAADRVHVSDDRGGSWRPIGQPLPEPSAVRGIAVARAPATIVLTTDRGLYRSTDAGRTWALQEGMLPVHLEAGPLVRDPADAATLYAGFALTPYEEMWRMAAEGNTMLGRLDLLSMAGGVAFLAVIAIGAAIALRRLGRYYQRPAARWPGPGISGSPR